MKSITRSAPMFPSPDANTTGKSLSSRIALCSAGIRSSSGSVPASKNFSINLSSPSATSSTSCSCDSCTCAHVGRNLRLFPFAVSTQFVGVGLHPHQVDHARQILFAANRQLDRNHIPSKRVDQRLQHPLRIRPVAVHAIHHNQPRRLIFLAIVPNPLRHHFHSGHSV